MSLIILEGPDGAGKTTLLDRLAKDFDYPVYHSGGPKNVRDMIKVLGTLDKLSALEEPFLCDRTPWVSELVYSYGLGRLPVLPVEVFWEYFKIPQRVIYCHLLNHDEMLANMSLKFKAHKPPEHTQSVIENYNSICDKYDVVVDHLERSGIDVFGYDWQNVSYDTLMEWI